MLSVFLFVVVFAFICGFISGRDDHALRNGSSSVVLCGSADGVDVEQPASVDSGCDVGDSTDDLGGSELWVEANADWLSELDAYFHADESSVSTLEDHIVYIMPNTIEVLTEMFNELPSRVLPTRYGWDVSA